MADRSVSTRVRQVLALATVAVLLFPTVLLAQSPWERAAGNLERTFTGPLARSLALVAIVIGGLLGGVYVWRLPTATNLADRLKLIEPDANESGA